MVDTRVKRYLDTLYERPTVYPRVNLEGEIVPWPDSRIFVSDIPSVLDFCTYEIGLRVKYGESIEGALIREVAYLREEVEGGSLEYRVELGRLEKALREYRRLKSGDAKATGTGLIGHEVIRGVGVEDIGSTRGSLETLFRGGGGLKFLDTFGLRGVYRGLGFSGRPDRVTFLLGGVVKELEGYKFTQGGTWRDYFETQGLIYAYFLYKIFGTLGFKYLIKVWPRGAIGVSNKDFRRAFVDESKIKPSVVREFKFDKYAVIKAQGLLDRVVDFFTGKVPCTPMTSRGCISCSMKVKCPYIEDFSLRV